METDARAADGLDAPASVTLPTETLGTVRDARARLCAAARAGPDEVLERALTAFVGAAWHAGFSYPTTWSIAAAALEEGLAPMRRHSRRARAAAWERRAQELYAALVPRADHDRRTT